MLKRLIRLWPFHNLRIEGWLPYWMYQDDAIVILWFQYQAWKDMQRPGVMGAYKRVRHELDKIQSTYN